MHAKIKKKTCMQLDYWGQTKKAACSNLPYARLGRLLPQRLAEFDGTVTNKALKGRTKPLKASKSRFKFTNTKMAAKRAKPRIIDQAARLVSPTAADFQMKIRSRPLQAGPCRQPRARRPVPAAAFEMKKREPARWRERTR